MNALLYSLTGRASIWLERGLRPMLFSREALQHEKGGSARDRTGLLVSEARRLPVLWKDDEILYVDFPHPAHSFWRAQELSLFHRNRARFAAPVVDFGCGDGSFGSALLDSIDVGIDNDPEALDVARGFGVYARLVLSTERSIPMEAGCARTVLSNSVLEHVLDLDAALAEIRRLLIPGGLFFFAVPVVEFEEQLARYFGRKESRRINIRYYHRNLLRAAEWERRLASHGFQVERILQYQPDWFTWWYQMMRFCGRRSLGLIVPQFNARLWGRCGRRLVRMVRRSIADTKQGANIFVTARRVKS